MRSLLLDVRGRNNLSREVQPFSEIVETLGGQRVVIILPRKLSLNVASRGQGLAGLDHEKVLRIDLGVLGKVEVLLRYKYALAEQVLFDQELAIRSFSF